jgi:hypothetical protein
LSEKDALVPAEHVERYLKKNNVPVTDADCVRDSFFEEDGDIKACVWREGYHGYFTDRPELVAEIAAACRGLSKKVEERESR